MGGYRHLTANRFVEIDTEGGVVCWNRSNVFAGGMKAPSEQQIIEACAKAREVPAWAVDLIKKRA